MQTADLFDGAYTITDDGRLYSNRTKKWLRPGNDKNGYLTYVVSINNKRTTFKAHRAVALSFIPNPDSKPTVDHINGNKQDNRVCNLRWATWKEQQYNEVTMKRAAIVHARTDYQAMGAKRNFGRKQVRVIYDTGEEVVFPTLKTAAEHLGIKVPKASKNATGKRKTTGGYRLCYV